jgi:uncharacterized protein YjiS (DUF1127 family)
MLHMQKPTPGPPKPTIRGSTHEIVRKSRPSAMHGAHGRHESASLAMHMQHAYLAARGQKCPIRRRFEKEHIMAATETTRVAPFGAISTYRISRMIDDTMAALAAWNDARITRKALGRLSDRELDDIGLCRGDIELIARR